MSYYVLERFCCECIAPKNETNDLKGFAENGEDGTFQSFEDKSKFRIKHQLTPNSPELQPTHQPSLGRDESIIEVKYGSQSSVQLSGSNVFDSDKYNLKVQQTFDKGKRHTLNSQTLTDEIPSHSNMDSSSYLQQPTYGSPSNGSLDDDASLPEPHITKLFTVSPQQEQILSDSESESDEM